MSLKQNEDWFETRAEWLHEQGLEEDDVLFDAKIGEYILFEMENGTPGDEGYGVDIVKIPLPVNLQTY